MQATLVAHNQMLGYPTPPTIKDGLLSTQSCQHLSWLTAVARFAAWVDVQQHPGAGHLQDVSVCQGYCHTPFFTLQ